MSQGHPNARSPVVMPYRIPPQWFELLPAAPPHPTAARSSLYDLVERMQESLEALDDAGLNSDCTVRALDKPPCPIIR